MSLERIRVSANQRYLVTESGQPFFWLGDTNWELFHRLTREEAELLFETRARQRFNVLQAVALAEFDGLNTPNAYGDRPLLDNDPARPNEAYFQFMDDCITRAATHGLYIGLLPTWGDKVAHLGGEGPIVFDAANAFSYGRCLGERYRAQTNVIWILGGDRPAATRDHDYRPIWRALAEGIEAGSGQPGLKTYHPPGGHSTSAWLQSEDWLDLHMLQSGHGGGHDTPVWETIERDYARTPVRPVLDGEPNYEDHPVNPWPTYDSRNGYFRDYDVRKQVYRSVFAGGCGVTYGHHSVWQFTGERHAPINFAEFAWTDALTRPGATQMQHLRNLMESRSPLTRLPDQSLLLALGHGRDQWRRDQHVRATRDADGSYAFVYLPVPMAVTVDVTPLAGERLAAWWYDPTSGAATRAGTFPRARELTLTPPGHRPDWVLVLDDAARGFAPPGQRLDHTNLSIGQ
jgi:hypothetical protein